MSLLSVADCDELLVSLGGGEQATLGGTSVPCIVAPVDAELLSDGVASAALDVVTRALAVTVRTGALAGLAMGATVVLRGANYKIDRVLRMRNDGLTQFLAFPS